MPFLPKKKPRRARRRPSKRGWSYPITFRSLVVKHPAPTQNFDRNFRSFRWHILELFGSIWDASRGSLEVVRSNFYQKCFRYSLLSKKCLGGSRMVLGVPQTPYKNINLFANLTFLLTHLFIAYWYWLLVLPIGPYYSLVESLGHVWGLSLES